MDSQWPTLEGRLKHAPTSREDAVRQLQKTMSLTPTAQRVLDRADKKASMEDQEQPGLPVATLGNTVGLPNVQSLMDEFISIQLVGIRDSTIQVYMRAFKCFMVFMEGQSINRESYARWVEWMIANMAHGTAASYRMKVARFLSYCLSIGAINYNPDKLVGRMIAPHKARSQKFITKSEYEELKRHARGGVEHWLIVLGYNTGMSLVDCCKLRIDSVDMHNLVIKGIRQKTGTEYVVTFEAGGELHTWLENMLREVEEGDTYVSEDAAAGIEFPNTRSQANMRALFKRARIKKTFHYFRHTKHSKLVHSGVPFEIGGRITGTKSRKIYDSYSTTDIGSVRDALRKSDSWEPTQEAH